MMQRREFITLLGGAAAAWPLTARAQPASDGRRIGKSDPGEENDRAVATRHRALQEGLAKLGWIEGRNMRFERRFSADDPDRLRAQADELVRLAPDVITVNS